jgi:hypothetical protein
MSNTNGSAHIRFPLGRDPFCLAMSDKYELSSKAHVSTRLVCMLAL